MKKKKNAFTLVELLVAMLIFAILALLLIPNVANKAEKELFVTQLKKVQNDIQQAMILMISQNNGTLTGYCADEQSNGCLINEIAEHLETRTTFSNADISTNSSNSTNGSTTTNGNETNTTKTETSKAQEAYDETQNPSTQAKAFKNKKPQFMNKTAADFNTHYHNNNNTFYATNLKNGATVSVAYNNECNQNATNYSGNPDDLTTTDDENNKIICGYMEVDINGNKAPNMVGKDIHFFWLHRTEGLVPFGEIDGYKCSNSKNNYGQMGCTYQIIQKGKIDYY